MQNMERSFPTLLGKGPVINGSECRSLAIIIGLHIQNYLLCAKDNTPMPQWAKQKKYLRNSLLTTLAGVVSAWGISLLHGLLKC